MPLQSVLKLAGLATADNPHSSVSEGALVRAQNGVLRYRNTFEPRRGQGYKRIGSSNQATSAGAVSTEGVWYQDALVLHHGTATLARDAGAATFTNYSGTLTPPDAASLRTKFLEMAGNLYFTTSAGIYGIDVVSATPVLSGVPAALGDLRDDPVGTAPFTDDDGWMASDTVAAYQYSWAIKDANGNLKEGAPGPIHIVRNRIDAASGSVSRTANVVTATTDHYHGLTTGDVVTLLTPNATFLAGPHTVTVTGFTTFTYAEVAANATSAIDFEYGASRNTALQPYIPPGIGLTHFCRIFRSKSQDDADSLPPAEVFLVQEVTPTATDISAGYLAAVTDRTPDSQLSVAAYWNANTGDGALQDVAKYRPPMAKDLLQWDGRAWALNTTDRHRFSLRLLGIGTPDGVQVNDTITIADVTFTAKTSPAVGINFYIKNGATTSIAIERTARDLVRVLNSIHPNVIAYYMSGVNDPPGMILIEERAVGGAAFTLGGTGFYMQASRGVSWAPLLPPLLSINTAALTRAGSTVTATTTANHGFSTGQVVRLYAQDGTADANYAHGLKTITVTGATTFTYSEAGTTVASLEAYFVHGVQAQSVNDRRAHAGSYSEIDEPEAFPLNNWVPIAPKGVELLRGIACRDRMYCFGDNGRAYSVSGPAPYRVEEIDGSARLIAPDSVVVHSNQVFALTDQGVGILTDAGFRIISKGIEDVVLDCLALTPAILSRYAFGVSYESERQYQLWLPTSNSDTCAEAGYIYNSLDNTWSGPWVGNRSWGRVSPVDGKLYMGDGTYGYVREERKSFDRTDYADEALAVTVASQSGDVVTLVSASGVVVGDVLEQGATKALITSINSNSCAVLPSGLTFTAAAATVYKSYEVALKWAPITLGSPRQMKTWRDVTFHFREYLTALMEGTFDTEENLTAGSRSIKRSPSYVAATYALTLGLRNHRVDVSDDHKMAAMLRVGLTIREAYAQWAVHGFTVDFELGGTGSRS